MAPMATSVRAAALPLVVDEVDRASAIRLDAEAIALASGLSLTSEQICGAMSAASAGQESAVCVLERERTTCAIHMSRRNWVGSEAEKRGAGWGRRGNCTYC